MTRHGKGLKSKVGHVIEVGMLASHNQENFKRFNKKYQLFQNKVSPFLLFVPDKNSVFRERPRIRSGFSLGILQVKLHG